MKMLLAYGRTKQERKVALGRLAGPRPVIQPPKPHIPVQVQRRAAQRGGQGRRS